MVNPYESPQVVDGASRERAARPLRSFMLRGFLRYLILVPFAWACGFGVYYCVLRFLYGQGLGGDAIAVLFWSGAALVVAALFVYLPVLNLLRWGMDGYWPLWPFPLATIALGWVPTALIVWQFGGGLRDLASPTSLLFYILFLVFGVILGTGFAWPRRSDENGRASGKPFGDEMTDR